MSPTFPYTYISCPCSDPSRRIQPTHRDWRDSSSTAEEDEDDEKTFDPHHPRSNYSLYPPEQLLYCEECHDIKCPRCITEEIVCWYCPSCLFETPSSMVRSEGNRCARNCFNCPICTASLVVQAIGDGAVRDGPWILNCNYCMWTSLDIGIKFDKPTNIRSQLDKTLNGNGLSRSESAELSRASSLSKESPMQDLPTESSTEEISDPVARFAALRSFYKTQLSTSAGNGTSSAYNDFASPSALTRIMSLYSTSGSSIRKPKSKPPLMREALTPSEGLQIGYIPSSSATSSLPPLPSDISSTPSPTQLLAQYPSTALGNPLACTTSDLRPMPTLLRTKRSKRCKACKHILVKPEFKPQSTRFRIRLIALAYLPLVTLRPLQPPAVLQHPLMLEPPVLIPGRPSQFILTLRNLLFEKVRVTLGVPGITPGKHGHRVTVLCPEFEMGANSDVWDDALAGPGAPSSMGGTNEGALMGGLGSGTMEAGKVFERGRNWIGVGLEIVCTHINPTTNPNPTTEDTDSSSTTIEIPIRVRLEWRQTDEDPTGPNPGETRKPRNASHTTAPPANAAGGEDEEDPGKRELAYWMVIGVGKVARL